jgi:hypothetical protein
MLISDHGVLPIGRVRLSFDVTYSDRTLLPRLYLYRKEDAEPQVIEGIKASKGRFSATLKITPDVVWLGLEPFDGDGDGDGDGRLAINNAQLKHVLF